jgi:hypothetical protein
MEVGYRILLKRIGEMAKVSVIRQRPFLRVKVSAELGDVGSRRDWLQGLLDTAPDGFSWVIPSGGFNDYIMELWSNDFFEL